MKKHDVTKTPLSKKKLSTHFSKILAEYDNLMPNKVLKLLRRYLSSFLSYRKNAGWVVIFTPSAAWVNRCHSLSHSFKARRFGKRGTKILPVVTEAPNLIIIVIAMEKIIPCLQSTSKDAYTECYATPAANIATGVATG